MIITKEHEGKRIEGHARKGVVLAVDGDYFWLKHDSGKENETCMVSGAWELVEDPKKPSERINELASEYREEVNGRGLDGDPWKFTIQGVIRYLDEQAAKK